MEIKSAKFLTSLTALDHLPKADKPEYAFIGRSNVGKSSLINMLCGQNKLAKVSGTPGKTQTINHFLINTDWYLVDLPGYGYAKTSKTLRALWQGFTYDYIVKRDNLQCVCVLLDSRLDPQKIDMEFMQWLGMNGIPFVMVFTKHDKLTKNQKASNFAKYKKEMLEYWEQLPEVFFTSAEEKSGKKELLDFFERINKSWKSSK
jgi:GTP-binding protein